MNTNRNSMLLLALVASATVLVIDGKSILNDEQSMGSSQDSGEARSSSAEAVAETPLERVYIAPLNRMPRWLLTPVEDNAQQISSNRIIEMLSNPILRMNGFSRKRSACMINAGMTAGCDFKDYIQSHQARKLYESGPGKRSGGGGNKSQQGVLMFAGAGGDSSPLSTNQQPQLKQKRMECLSGLPGGDCENSFLGSESLGQDFLRPGGRNPGRR